MIHKLLSGKKVVLASGSPRRKAIFQMIGINALQIPPNIDETITTHNPRRFVCLQAKNKAKEVNKNMDTDCIVVAADTIVYHNNEILGKPKNVYQAADYLSRLSNNKHSVYTGISVSYCGKTITDFSRTSVIFNSISMYEIEEYITTKEPMDKAGAYGIQGYGSQFINSISGCYFNVMGFPVALFYEIVKKLLQPDYIQNNEKTIS